MSFTLIMLSCKSDNDNGLLVGAWQGVEFLVNGSEDTRRAAADFNFDFQSDGSYTYNFGAVHDEEGRFEFKEGKLYTWGKEKRKNMVKVNLVSDDFIVMDMDASGIPQTLKLKRLSAAK